MGPHEGGPKETPLLPALPSTMPGYNWQLACPAQNMALQAHPDLRSPELYERHLYSEEGTCPLLNHISPLG